MVKEIVFKKKLVRGIAGIDFFPEPLKIYHLFFLYGFRTGGGKLLIFLFDNFLKFDGINCL